MTSCCSRSAEIAAVAMLAARHVLDRDVAQELQYLGLERTPRR